MVSGVEPTHSERTSALLIRLWIEDDRSGGERVVIRIAARADVESGEQESAVFSDVVAAGAWVERWLSAAVTEGLRLAGQSRQRDGAVTAA